MSRSGRLSVSLFALALCPAAFAGTFTVNSTLDLRDATPLGDGVVDVDLATGGDQITLRGAIEEANALAGADQIYMPAGVFDLTRNGASENLCAKGDLDVRDTLAIYGEGDELTFIDGHLITDRVFHVIGTNCDIYGVTIRRGTTASAKQNGGGIFASGGTLILWNSTVTNNHSRGDGGGVAIQAGSFYSYHTLFSGNVANDDGGGVSFGGNLSSSSMQNSTFSKNVADEDGGGVFVSHANVTLFNSTLSRNEAARGGGIAVANLSQLVVMTTTLARNVAPMGSGIWENTTDGDNDGIALASAIVANTKSSNYSGDGLLSLGNNLDSGTTCNLIGTGDKKNKDAKLAQLKNTGGETPTVGLLSASPAVDAGSRTYAGSFDQRGKPRVDIPGKGPSIPDMGSFERQSP